jgi:uncharacterized protein
VKLQYNGQELVPASIDSVWAFVTDPEKVGRCLPDVVDVTVVDPTHFDAVVRVGLGPKRLTMKISGGGLGSALDLTAGADLAPAGDATTTLNWSGEAEMRGPIAAVGGRVLDAQAKRLIEQTFANVRTQLSV